MLGKLRFFDLGVCLVLCSFLCCEATIAYRNMGYTLTTQDVVAPQSLEFLFRQSLSNMVTSRDWLWLSGIGLLAVLVGTILRIKSKRMSEDPLYWFRFGALTLWLLLLPVATIAGNYFALWHPLGDGMIALAKLTYGGLGLSGLVFCVLDLLPSKLKRPTSPPLDAPAPPLPE